MTKPTLFVFLACAAAMAQGQPRADVYRATSKIRIDAKFDEADWQKATPVGDFHFNWWNKEGEREKTVAKILWDDENLYVSWVSDDKHISARVTQRHGPVSKDDCVEIFLSPNPEKVKNYYTFEINAIGAMLNRCRTDWWTGPATWEPEGVQYRTTFHGMTVKEESPSDRQWICEMAIPLKNFTRDAAHTPPRDGDVWRINLYRTGGVTNAQDTSWSPIPSPAKSFHTQEAFGYVRFVNRPAGTKKTEQGKERKTSMRVFDHVGLPTEQKQAGEMYVPATKVWVTDPAVHPQKIEFLRYEKDSPVKGPVRDLPHMAFQVDDLDAEMEGAEVILGPFQPTETLRVVFVMKDGAVFEFMENKGDRHWHKGAGSK